MIEILRDHLASGHRVRPGTKLKPEYITIHSTGNASAPPENERKWLDNPSNTRSASWHICIGETSCIEAIPLNEVAWHAGNGNIKSISIEICENGNRAKILERAVELTAALLLHYGWTTDKLKRHYDWTGKSCPWILMANNWEGWNKFKKDVDAKMKEKPKFKYIDFNFGTVNTDDLNIRKTPDTKHDPVGKLNKGDTVAILGSEGNWYKIAQGYISKTYVDAVYKENVPEKDMGALKIKINGEIMNVDGFIKDGRTYIQIRELGNITGAYTLGFENGIPIINTKK